jgi:hypothetical protein
VQVAGASAAAAVSSRHATLLSQFRHAGGPRDISGIWKAFPPDPRSLAKTSSGEAIPMTPATRSIFLHRVAMTERGTPVVSTSAECLPALPIWAFLSFLSPYDIVQTRQVIAILGEVAELSDEPWVIHLDRGHPTHLTPTFHGDWVGHWEGSTLVADGVGFKPMTWLDYNGLPHSSKLHMVLRIRKVAEGTGLRVDETVIDPLDYTHPWTVTYLSAYQPDLELLPQHCLENVRPQNNAGMVYEDLKPIPGVNSPP